MEGIDLPNMLISLNTPGLKSHSWYLRLLAQVLDISVNNAWLPYRRDCSALNIKKNLPLKAFRYDIIQFLLRSNKPKIGRPAIKLTPETQIGKPVGTRSTDDTGLDNVDHFPLTTNDGRCRL